MKKKLMEVFDEYSSCIDLGMIMDVREFCESGGEANNWECDWNINESKEVIINIKLREYLFSNTQTIFYNFLSFISYENGLYVCNRKENEVKYSLLTINSEGEGTKMIITIT